MLGRGHNAQVTAKPQITRLPATGPQGAPGNPGTQIMTGTGAPNAGAGVTDDLYIDTSASPQVFYKKMLNGWQSL